MAERAASGTGAAGVPSSNGNGRHTHVPVSRQLPESDAGLAQRMVAEVRYLVEDAVSLAELRLKKLQIEVEERIDQKVNRALAAAIAGTLLGIGGLFVLIAVSLALGEWLGHSGWGFLIVGSVLAVAGFMVLRKKPELVHVGSKQAIVDRDHLDEAAPIGQPHVEHHDTSTSKQ